MWVVSVAWVVLVVASSCTTDARRADKPPNRAPEFPSSMSYTTSSTLEKDGRGLVIGAITSLETTSHATDPDGDSLTYRWEGLRYNGDTLLPMPLDADGMRVKFRSGVIMGEPAGGVLRLIARDPSGKEAVTSFCISGGGFTC
jgi:hypothetical protein